MKSFEMKSNTRIYLSLALLSFIFMNVLSAQTLNTNDVFTCKDDPVSLTAGCTCPIIPIYSDNFNGYTPGAGPGGSWAAGATAVVSNCFDATDFVLLFDDIGHTATLDGNYDFSDPTYDYFLTFDLLLSACDDGAGEASDDMEVYYDIGGGNVLLGSFTSDVVTGVATVLIPMPAGALVNGVDFIFISSQTSSNQDDLSIDNLAVYQTYSPDPVTWHDALTGGTQVAAGSSFNPSGVTSEEGTTVDFAVADTHTFYADCACGLGGSVPAREQVVLTIEEVTPPVATADFTVCEGGTVGPAEGLGATCDACLPQPSQTYIFSNYVDATGGLGVDGTGATFVNAGTITIPPGAVPNGWVVEDINVTVEYDKTDGSCGSPGAANSYLGEFGLGLDAPDGTRLTFVVQGTYSGANDISPGVTQTFDDEAGAPPPGGVPVNGTYQPAVGSLSTFDGSTVEGTWEILGNDNAGGDPLCVIGASLEILVSPPPSGVSWWDAPTGGTEQDFTLTGDPFDPTGFTAEEGAVDLNTGGTYTFYAQCECNGCAADTRTAVTLLVSGVSAADAGTDQIICEGDVANLSGTLPGGTGTWSGGVGVFGDASAAVTTYTPDPSEYGTTVALTLTPSGGGGCLLPDQVNIVIEAPSAPDAAYDLYVCQGESLPAGEGLSVQCENCPKITTTEQIFYEDFDPTDLGWSISNGVESSTNCGAVAGNSLWFDSSSGIREAITRKIDITDPGIYTLDFTLFIGPGNGTSCDFIEAGDDVVVDYTTDGVSYTTIGVYNSGDAPSVNGCVTIPPATSSTELQIRFHQPVYSTGGSFDNWSIDDVTVTRETSFHSATTSNWYNVPTGGAALASNVPKTFDPTGLTSEEGTVVDLNVPGDYTFYAECNCVPNCSTRTPVVLHVAAESVAGKPVLSDQILCCAESATITNPTASYDGTLAIDDPSADYSLAYVISAGSQTVVSSQAAIDARAVADASYVFQANAADGSDDGATIGATSCTACPGGTSNSPLTAGVYSITPFISTDQMNLTGSLCETSRVGDLTGGSAFQAYQMDYNAEGSLNNLAISADNSSSISVVIDDVLNPSAGCGCNVDVVYVDLFKNGGFVATISSFDPTTAAYPVSVNLSPTDFGGITSNDDLTIQLAVGVSELNGNCAARASAIDNGVYTIEFDVDYNLIYIATFPEIGEGRLCEDFGNPTDFLVLDPICLTSSEMCNVSGTYDVTLSTGGGLAGLNGSNYIDQGTALSVTVDGAYEINAPGATSISPAGSGDGITTATGAGPFTITYPQTTTSYTVDVYNWDNNASARMAGGGCPAQATGSINIPPTPSSVASATICQGDAFTGLTAVAPSCSPGTANITWWDAATGGTQVGTGTTFDPTGTIGMEGTTFSNTTVGTFTYYAAADCSGCASARIMASVTVDEAPIPNAGANTNVCADNTNLAATAATVGTGMWSTSSFAVIADASSPTSAVSNLAVGPNTFTWTVTNGVCSVSSDVIITRDELPIADAGDDITICADESATLSASLGGSATSGTWSGGAGTFSSNTDPNAIYTPDASEAGTTVTLTWTTDDPAGPCPPASDDMNITVNAVPIASLTCPSASLDRCTGVFTCNQNDLNSLTVGTSTGIFSGTAAAFITGDTSPGGTATFDPLTMPTNVPLTLIYTVINNGCVDSVSCTFTIVDNRQANPGGF